MVRGLFVKKISDRKFTPYLHSTVIWTPSLAAGCLLPQADHSLLVGPLLMEIWALIFCPNRRNADEQYGGYNLLQNAEFNAIFSLKVWRKCDKLKAKGTHTPTHGLKEMCMKKRPLLRSTLTPLTEGGLPVQLQRQSFWPTNRITFPSFSDHQSINQLQSIFICPFTY